MFQERNRATRSYDDNREQYLHSILSNEFEVITYLWYPTFGRTRARHCSNHINHMAGYISVDYFPETGWKDLDEKRVIILQIENDDGSAPAHTSYFHLAHMLPWKIWRLTHPDPSAKLTFIWLYLWRDIEQNVQSDHFRPKSLETVGWIWANFGPDYKCCEPLSHFWLNLSKLSHI